MLVHQGGGVDRPYPLFYSSCRAPTFIPPRAGESARSVCSLPGSQSKERIARARRRVKSNEHPRKRTSRWNRCVSKGRRSTCFVQSFFHFWYRETRVKTDSEIRATWNTSVITNTFYIVHKVGHFCHIHTGSCAWLQIQIHFIPLNTINFNGTCRK